MYVGTCTRNYCLLLVCIKHCVVVDCMVCVGICIIVCVKHLSALSLIKVVHYSHHVYIIRVHFTAIKTYLQYVCMCLCVCACVFVCVCVCV